jgi:hypothetical protein
MTNYNMQCILYTCYLCVGSAGMASAKNIEFLGEQGQYSLSSAVHHLQGAPILKGVCYVTVIVHYKHESSTAGV